MSNTGKSRCVRRDGFTYWPVREDDVSPVAGYGEPDVGTWDEDYDPDGLWAWANEGNPLCVLTGWRSGVWVLDIDGGAGKVGYDTLAALEAQHGPLPPTFTVSTPSGGEHRYFLLPPGGERVMNDGRGQVFGANIDIRGDYGIVVAAGTHRPAAGSRVEGFYGVKHDLDVAETPAWMIPMLLARKTKGTKGKALAPVDDHAPSEGVRYLSKEDGIAELHAKKERYLASDEGSGFGGAAFAYLTHYAAYHRAIGRDASTWNKYAGGLLREHPNFKPGGKWAAGLDDQDDRILERTWSVGEKVWVLVEDTMTSLGVNSPKADGSDGGGGVSPPDDNSPPPQEGPCPCGGEECNPPTALGRWTTVKPDLTSTTVRTWLRKTGRPIVSVDGQILYEWSMGRWNQLSPTSLRESLLSAVERATYPQADAQGRMTDKPYPTNSASINNLLTTAITVCTREKPIRPKDQIVFRNGTLDVDTGRLRPHARADWNTTKVELDWDEEATAPRWEEFVREVMPDPADYRLLQEVFGYLLSGRRDAEKFFHFWGPVRAGKGVIVRVLGEILGDGMQGSSLSSMSGEFGLAHCLDASVIVLDEAHFDTRSSKAVDILTSLSGNGVMVVNRKGKDLVTTYLPGRLLLTSNAPLDAHTVRAALSTRLIALRFTQSFLGREDAKLSEKLAQELPGIVVWALAGLHRLNGQGGRFTESSGHLETQKSVRLAADSLGAWYDERIEQGGETDVGELSDDYLAWARANDVDLTTAGEVSRVVGNYLTRIKGLKTRASSGKRYRPVTLRAADSG